MAQPGDTITYSYTGSKVTEDISEVDEISIDYMDGAGGGPGASSTAGGSGGRVENATADVSSYNTLEIWVGSSGSYDSDPGGWGRSNGGAAEQAYNDYSGSGGGSTELWTDSNTTFIAAADGGGGGGHFYSSIVGDYNAGGGGGARGGLGGSPNGNDAGGTGSGGAGGEGSSSVTEDGFDGGAELGIASGGTTTLGGGSSGDGEIQITYKGPFSSSASSESEVSRLRNGKLKNTSLPSYRFGTPDTIKTRIYRSTTNNPTFPDDFTQIDEVDGEITDYEDTNSPFGSNVHYAVTKVADGDESRPGISDTFIPPQDAAGVDPDLNSN